MAATETTRRTSRKRDAILEAMWGTTCHPSAQWVYDALRPDYPNISLGTVYRNLKFFVDSGEIISIGIVNGQERYDACTTPHAHFICTSCEAVIDLEENGEIAKNYNKVGEKIGGEVTSHSIVFNGLCKSCCRKK